MGMLKVYWPFILPLAAVQLVLMLTALIHLIRHRKTRTLNVPVWAVIIVLGEIVGPILYLVFGREDA
ncbi:MAG: PLDc N-terminal domain-containing protein [Ethanoligenens sp.]|uniref:PLDc N-terminal domain-containing protein n=1 Tax=Ethanoligenens sp. TaxID=2099655 RepID=UPI0039E78EB5